MTLCCRAAGTGQRAAAGACRRAYSVASSEGEPPRKRVVFSGIQPTGIPHIGNHLGALSQWQKLVREAAAQPAGQRDQLFFSVVGLHALTVPQDPKTLKKERMDMLAALFALGLNDPAAGAVVFHQDQVPEHTELAWYLNCITPVHRLMRMTSWKGKLAQLRNANSEDEVDESLLQLGLLAYPVLQAADVLLYKTTHVPVGHDQAQHLELARDLAQSFNRQYPKDAAGKKKRFFPIPEVMLANHPRIRSLRQPAQKMSKSAPQEASKILLTDEPAAIASKIKSAVTDSTAGVTWDPENRPGVAGLLQIHAGYSGEDVEALAAKFAGARGIMELKASCTDAVTEGLRSFREEYARLRGEKGYLEAAEREGAGKARARAREVMDEVKRVAGTA